MRDKHFGLEFFHDDFVKIDLPPFDLNFFDFQVRITIQCASSGADNTKTNQPKKNNNTDMQ